MARPDFADSDEQRVQGAQFCQHGLYLKGHRDSKGTLHEYVLFYYVTTRAGPTREWVSTFSSADGWMPINYSEAEARRLFASDLVDRLLERHRRGR